jgi:integrase
MRTKCMRLRVASVTWHPRYRYSIGGLRVNGKRKRLFFETLREAQEALRNLQIKARSQGQAGLDISDNLRAMAADCARQLEPYGKTLLDATSFFLTHLKASESVRAGELVDNYLASRERSNLSAHHLADIRTRLTCFREAFGERPARTMAAAELEEWLYGRCDGRRAQTLAHWRATLRAFFAWALGQKLIDFNPADGIARPKVVRSAPAIWTPENLSKLLAAAPADLRPVLAIGAFSGLRTSELLKLTWAEVNLSRGFIEIVAAKAKSARRRLVKIEPNLVEWLAPCDGSSGKLWPHNEVRYHVSARRLARELGLEWPANGLRHSYASYHLARFEDAGRTALQMGHTTSHLIFEHYRELVSPQDAQRYWEIRP